MHCVWCMHQLDVHFERRWELVTDSVAGVFHCLSAAPHPCVLHRHRRHLFRSAVTAQFALLYDLVAEYRVLAG